MPLLLLLRPRKLATSTASQKTSFRWKNVNLDLSASIFSSIMNFEFPDLYFEKLDRGGKDRLWMRREGGQLGQKGDNLLSDLGLEGIRNHLGLEGF